MQQTTTITLLSIGDEVLIGQVINTNVSWLSQFLTDKGLDIRQHLTVADTQEAIQHGLELSSKQANIVLVTGGLGPTKDDVTKSAVAAYFSTKLTFHQPTFDRIQRIMNRIDVKIYEGHRLQSHLPEAATLYENPVGTAPGMRLEKDGITYYFMPGVPFEMHSIFETYIWPELAEVSTHMSIKTRTICTAGVGETTIETALNDIVEQFPKKLSIAYLPSKSTVRIRITGNGISDEVMDGFKDQIATRLDEAVYGFADFTLVEAIAQKMLDRGWTLGLAESCTGGAISAEITKRPGASRFYHGSILSYDNRIKTSILGVSEDTIKQYGAVSELCVHEMVQGALDVLQVDVAIAISGIAGPTGGSKEKPVGTVFIGVGSQKKIVVKKFIVSKSRVVNLGYFIHFALNMLRLFLMNTANLDPLNNPTND